MKSAVVSSTGGKEIRTINENSTSISSGGVTYLLQGRGTNGTTVSVGGGGGSQCQQKINGTTREELFRRYTSTVQLRRVGLRQGVADRPDDNVLVPSSSSSSEFEIESRPKRFTKTWTQGKKLKRCGGKLAGQGASVGKNRLRGLDVTIVRSGGKVDDSGSEDENVRTDQEDTGSDEGDNLSPDGDENDPKGRSAWDMIGDEIDIEYLRNVIETQILNRHTTKMKDWDGTKGHMCQSCHETFLSEGGLETHRNRKILHILFYCRHCNRDISFFNKCRLLQHLRNHRVTPTILGLQNCTMIRLLPESEYLHFEYEECTTSSDEDASGSAGPPKRLKPTKFRKVKNPGSGNNNDLESPDNSPGIPDIQKLDPPPKQLPANQTAPPTLVPVPPPLNNTIGTIKFAGTSERKIANKEPPRNDQVTVIKSTGVISPRKLPPLTVVPKEITCSSAVAEKITPVRTPSPIEPQIRIRSLSQIIGGASNEDDGSCEDKQIYLPSINASTTSLDHSMQRPQIVKVPAPTTTSELEASRNMQKKEYYCGKCEKKFLNADQFFTHLKDAEEAGLISKSLHRCPKDDIPSWSQCQYVYHTKVFHEQSVPYMCPGCGEEHSNYVALLEHATNKCFYMSQRALYMCAASLQKCSFSDRKCVKTEPEIIDHLKKEHSRAVLQCLHCTQGFATENWLLKHLADTHDAHFDDSKTPAEREAFINKMTRPLTQCLVCNILFPNGPTYLQHVYLNFHVHILYARMLECQSCSTVFETNEELIAHRNENEKCKKVNIFRQNSPEENNMNLGLTPTPIKIIANPAAIINTTNNISILNTALQAPLNVPSESSKVSQAPVVTSVISSTNGVGSSASKLKTFPSQKSPQGMPRPPLLLAKSTCQRLAQSSSQSSVNNSNANSVQNKGFEDLLSCQYCERLVVYSSLRKHEDQCSGLSTVAPGFCLACRQNFGNRKTMARHALIHMREGFLVCVFCNNRHIRPTHPKDDIPTDGENLAALKKHVYSNHTSRAVNFPIICPICDHLCYDKRDTESHFKEHQFPTSSVTKDPDPVPIPYSEEELPTLIQIRRKVMDTQKKVGEIVDVYFCPLCRSREFAQEKGLCRHLELVHKKDPATLDLTKLRKESATKRFIIKAGPPPPKLSPVPPRLIAPRLSSGGMNNSVIMAPLPISVVRRNISVDSSPHRARVGLRKRAASNSNVEPPPKKTIAVAVAPRLPNTRLKSSMESSKEVRPMSSQLLTRTASTTTVRKRDGTFMCHKCPDFICSSEVDFYDHVKWTHIWSEEEIQKLQYGNKEGLEEPSEYWCPECNLVFVAKPTLIKHLKFAHSHYILNVDEYMQKIGYDGKKPLKPFQCEVCYFQCPDDRELQQHMRTHGMAFLRLRQERQSSSK